MRNIFEYIKEEENAFKTTNVPISDGYEWNMYEHVRMCTLFRDSKFTKGPNDYSRPFRNIIRRIRNLALVAMDFDVKDIVPFVLDSENYYKSFLVKQYHPQWARQNDIDTYIDELIESYEDYGLALSKHVNQVSPVVVPLQSVAFCDQTDILSGPICLKHQFSPAQIKAFEGSWGEAKYGADATLDELIALAVNQKVDESGNQVTRAPGKFIEVYELDGMFPNELLRKNGEDAQETDETEYSQQMHVVAFYTDSEGDKKGLTLYKGKGDPKKYKALVRDKIYGRACGMSGIEELFHSQIWTNYDEIRIQEMLDAASKIVHITTDDGLASRNNLDDVENNEFLKASKDSITQQLNTQPVNLVAFQNASTRWEEHAKGIGSAYDAQLGESPTAGTPFKLQDAVITQGESLHKKRRGKIATHLGEVYRDWILADLVREMNKEKEFIKELSLDELEYCADAVVTYEANERVKQMILAGEQPTQEEVDVFKQLARESFMKDNRKFFSILKDELKDLPVDVEINVAGKQADLGHVSDTMSNLLRQIFANPQGFMAAMQIPGAAASFNDMLEASGVSPWRFNKLTQANVEAMQPLSTPTQTPLAA